MTTEPSKTPSHHVYAIITRPGTRKPAWVQIGAAWPHQDGKGFSFSLDTLPRDPAAEFAIRMPLANEGDEA